MKQEHERHPIPDDPVERFMGVVFSLVEPFGIDKIPDVFHYVELLGNAVDRHVFESTHHVSPVTKQASDRKKFITIFKARYLHLTDMEFTRVISPVDCKLINQVIKTLLEANFTIEEFLEWVFGDFLVENQKFCPPMIKQICSGFVMERFMYIQKDRMKERHLVDLQEKEQLDLIGRARVMLRDIKGRPEEEKVKNLLRSYKETHIIDVLRSGIEAMEKEWQQTKAKEGVNDGLNKDGTSGGNDNSKSGGD